MGIVGVDIKVFSSTEFCAMAMRNNMVMITNATVALMYVVALAIAATV
jgi:hypothetical protein